MYQQVNNKRPSVWRLLIEIPKIAFGRDDFLNLAKGNPDEFQTQPVRAIDE